MRRTFCTVVSSSHLAYAKALKESLASSGNSESLQVLVTDWGRAGAQSDACGLQIRSLAALDGCFPARMPYYFDAFELCNAIKPFFVRHLLSEGFEQVIYLDSDLFVTGSFSPVWSQLEHWPLLLTPHNLEPLPLELQYVNEASIADMGILNGGFAAWRTGDATRRMLDWMCTRFPIYGFSDRGAAMFVDQKLLPLLLEYFPEHVGILRDAGLNIAYWNAHERGVRCEEGKYFIGDEEVVFFHMSGFRISKPGTLCSYLGDDANRTILAKAPWFVRVLENYHSLLSRYWTRESVQEYGFARLNGLALTPALRRVYFRKAALSPWDPDVSCIRFKEFLKRIKHLFLSCQDRWVPFDRYPRRIVRRLIRVHVDGSGSKKMLDAQRPGGMSSVSGIDI